MTGERVARLRQGQEHGQAVARRLLAVSRQLETAAAERVVHRTAANGARRTFRVDVLSVMEDTNSHAERIAVIDEIKLSDWDRMAPHRVRPNIRRFVRQIWRYIEADEMAEFPIAMAAIHFSRRPADARAAEVEKAFAEEGITVVWS